MQQFCLISYQHGRPIAAERMTAADDGDAVAQVLARQGKASFEIYQRQRLVAVLQDGLVTMPAARAEPPPLAMRTAVPL